MTSKFIVINSIDRDWNNTASLETPYSFRVVFGNNSRYGATNQNLNILVNDVLKDVKYLECQKVLISNRDFSDKFRPSNQPYLLLNIDNIEQVSDASNSKLQNALAILTPKIPMAHSHNECKYLEYDNTNFQKKEINRTIPYMDIRLQRGDGTIINYDQYQNDILNIHNIYYDSANTVLNIQTNDFFSNKDFQEGDIIKIRDYNFRESSLNYYETALFNEYINREQGHIIQSITVDSSNTGVDLNNIIKILPASENSTSTGNLEVKEWFSDLVTKTNVENSNLAFDESGKLINTNLQTTIFFKVDMN